MQEDQHVKPLLKMSNISKKYGEHHVLHNIDFTFDRGKIYGLLGVNGAGKSTLLKILARFEKPSIGQIEPSEKNGKHHVVMVHQELSLFEELDVTENLMLSEYKKFVNPFFLDRKNLDLHAKKALKHVGLEHLNLRIQIKDLTTAQAQLVEIAKALSQDPDILILDEPTSALSTSEIKNLFEVLDQLRKKNKSILFVSHKLDEVVSLCDQVLILRDGRLVEVLHKNSMNAQNILSSMLGKKVVLKAKSVLEKNLPLQAEKITKPLLFLTDFTIKKKKQPRIKIDSLKIFPGECVILDGPMGSGRSLVLESLGSLLHLSSNHNKLPVPPGYTCTAKLHTQPSIGFIHEDRKRAGLFYELSAKENITVSRKQSTNKNFHSFFSRLGVRSSHPSLNEKIFAKNLSGGNQQKLLLGRALIDSPELLLLDEPTKGVDAQARAEIYQLLRDFCLHDQKSILLVSSDVEEMAALSELMPVRILKIKRDGTSSYLEESLHNLDSTL